MKKRLLSAALALAMLCSAVPVPVYADDLVGDGAVILTETTTGEETPASTEVTEVTEATATPVPTEVPAPAGEPAPQTLGLAPSLLAANDGVSTLSALSTLIVGGTDVLGGGCWKTNADGTLTTDGASESDYNVKYDSTTGTLTLKDATITGTDTSGHVGAGIYAEGGDLTIVLEGSSTVKGVVDSNGESQSIRVSGNLTIQGDGSLTAQGANTSNRSSYGIYVFGSFTQQSGSVTAIGGNVSGNYNSAGLYVYNGTVTVLEGTLEATGGSTGNSSYGISMSASASSSSSVTVGSAAVTATGGTGKESYGLYFESSSPSVTLSGSGSLTARSGTATKTAGGIYLDSGAGTVTVGNGSTLLANSVILRAWDQSWVEKPLAPTGDGSWLIYGQSNQATPMQGDVTLPDDLTIPTDAKVTIPAGSTLTVPQSKTLTNNGTLNIANQSSLAGDGTLAGSGAFNLTNPDPVITGSETLTYDGTDHFTDFSLTAPTGSVKVMEKDFTISGSATTEGWTLETQEIKNAGTYTLTASHTDDTRTIKKNIKVNPAEISIASATVQDKTYDGTTTATVGSVTFSGRTQPAEADYTASAVFDNANAGDSKNATVTVSLNNSNYSFAQSGNSTTATANITERPATVGLQLDPANRIYVGGNLPAVGLTYSGLVDGESIAPDSFTLTGMPSDSSVDGEHSIELSDGSKQALRDKGMNYNITFTGVTLTILDSTVVVLPSQDAEKYRLEQTGLTGVPDELNTTYGNLNDLQNNMLQAAVKAMPGVTAEHTVWYDITLLISKDRGHTWDEAAQSDFPAEGLSVILPYPAGTNAANYEFAVTQMFTVAYGEYQAGDVETPAVTKTSTGLKIRLNSLSPVSISWKYAPKTENGTGGGGSGTTAAPSTSAPAPTATPAPDGIEYYTCPACGHHNWTATDEGYRCDTCGYLESVKQLSGYGNVKGVYDPKTGSSAAAGTATATVPQTGDESNPALWLGLLIVSALGLGGVFLYRRKKKHNG